MGTLTFTDPFGHEWTTKPIYVNERLSSKAYVSSTDQTVVTFSPSLPYGELEVGDYLMVVDERQEVLTTYPVVDTTIYRPQKIGGVVDSVKVRNTFSASSTNVYCFRAGPAKGIKAALEALPNKVVPSVTTEAFNTGQLIGYHYGEMTTSSGITTIKNILGDYDRQGYDNRAVAGPKYAMMDDNGGLAPYDTIRVTATGGKSQFVQLRNVDVYPTGEISVLHAKGKVTESLGNELEFNRGLGIGQGTTGAIYRAGGHHVRVTFNENAGDLPEMQADTSGLYSVFLREFAGTVTAADPRKVQCKLHGNQQFDASVKTNPFAVGGNTGTSVYQVPASISTNAADASNLRNMGDNTPFKGDVQNLKVMAGMKVKLADQVRVVTSDITGSSTTAVPYFYVDEPFLLNDASEMVDDVEYVFHNYPVEQIYDKSTYNMLTMSRAVYLPPATKTFKQTPYSAVSTGAAGATLLWDTNGGSTTNSAANPQMGTVSAAFTGTTCVTTFDHTYTGTQATDGSSAASSTQCSELKGKGGANVLASLFPVGSRVFVSGCSHHNLGTGVSMVVGYMKTDGLEFAGALSGRGGTALEHSTQVNTDCQLRVYDTMANLADGTSNQAPPLHLNNRVNWITVTDQRPLKWNTPERSLATTSKILPSPSNIAMRGVMAGGAASLTYFNDGTLITTTIASTSLTIGGANAPSFEDYFKVRDGYTTTTAAQTLWYLSVSGCEANPGMTREVPITGMTATVLTIGAGHNLAASVGPNQPYSHSGAVCVGNWVYMISRAGTLIDSKAIAIGDRVKYLEEVSTTSGSEFKQYETRTVDKIWGSALDVTMFSVKDGYQIDNDGSTARPLQDSAAWVDESGSTEESECSARGICDTEEGVCTCFPGYAGNSCERQDALSQ